MYGYTTVVIQPQFRAIGPYLQMDSSGYPLNPPIDFVTVKVGYLSPVPPHVVPLFSMARGCGLYDPTWLSPEEDEAWKDL